ncbi:peptidase S41 [Pedobacter sp. KBS0701]|uniref:S41 family peptidase n=1 Tax=Pedobacter sp. KBS0701 TaxID=2578106 RepID=UPI00110ED512|nr:S41 family peptidase [Pedobacter sp. KBS0701]QDW27125.1 peptidase S41 [Pedobacter sp. KBS0701]
MKQALLFICIFSACCVKAQFRFNGDFEDINPSTKKPLSWLFSFNQNQEKAYQVVLDSITKQSGKYSLSISQIGQEANFGAIDFPISQAFEGKVIELKGYIKTENVKTGYAGLWMRLDGKEHKAMGFDNMNNRGVKGNTDWQLFSIKLDYKNDEVREIHVGALLIGDGKAWFDHLELFIDGKPIEQAKFMKIELAKAELDTAFQNSSGIKQIELNEQKTTNLMIAGQFWAFLKYHHPAIAKGDYNWDAELFRFLPSVLAAKSNQELSITLEQYLDKLPKPNPCKTCAKIAAEKYEITPDYGSLLNGTVLSRSLGDKLTYIKDNRNTGPNYYIEMDPNIGNPMFKNEKGYASMTFPDAGYRLLSLYRYWGMINYFFPYKNVIGEDWNKILTTNLPVFLGAKNEQDYSLAALSLIARVHDTHANLWSGSKALSGFKGKLAAPFQAKFIEDKLIITALHTDTLDVKSKLAVGDVITAINGKDIPGLIREYLPITAASNYDTQLRDLPGSYLLRSNDNSIKISVKRGNQLFDYTVPMGKLALAYKNPAAEKAEAFKLINQDIGYVYPGKYKNDQLPAIKKLFANTKGIIVDMRCYPSEFMPFTFGNYIKNEKSVFVKFTAGSTGYPGAFSFGSPIKNGQSSSEAYKGKIVVIVNATSQSQAEYTTMAFQSTPNVKVIGSTTAGADGNVSSIVLPGGLNTMISGLGVFYPNGTPTQRVGVKIDYKIYPTIAGISAGKDELLDKAIEVLNTGW